MKRDRQLLAAIVLLREEFQQRRNHIRYEPPAPGESRDEDVDQIAEYVSEANEVLRMVEEWDASESTYQLSDVAGWPEPVAPRQAGQSDDQRAALDLARTPRGRLIIGRALEVASQVWSSTTLAAQVVRRDATGAEGAALSDAADAGRLVAAFLNTDGMPLK